MAERHGNEITDQRLYECKEIHVYCPVLRKADWQDSGARLHCNSQTADCVSTGGFVLASRSICKERGYSPREIADRHSSGASCRGSNARLRQMNANPHYGCL